LSNTLLHLLRFGKNVAENCFCQDSLNLRNLPTLLISRETTHSENPGISLTIPGYMAHLSAHNETQDYCNSLNRCGTTSV